MMPINSLFAFVVLTITMLGSVGCKKSDQTNVASSFATTQAPPNETSAVFWGDYLPLDDVFMVRMPKPQDLPAKDNSIAGLGSVSVKRHMIQLKHKDGSTEMAHVYVYSGFSKESLDKKPSEILECALNHLVLKNKLIKTSNIKIANLDGLECEIERAEEAKLYLSLRLFFVRNKVYAVIYGSSVSDHEPNRKIFLDSFMIIKQQN